MWSGAYTVEFPAEVDVKIVINDVKDFANDDFVLWISKLQQINRVGYKMSFRNFNFTYIDELRGP